MFRRLPISLAQLRAGNNSEKLKIEIRKILYYLYRSKKLQSNSIKVWLTLFKMETIFMNTENSKTNEPHIFKLDFTYKLNLKTPNKNMALANLSIYYTWKNIKSEYSNNEFQISALTWNDTFDLYDSSYLISDIQDCLNLSSKNMKLWQKIPQFKFIQIKLKTELFSKKRLVLTPETIKLLGSTKKDVDSDKNNEI